MSQRGGPQIARLQEFLGEDEPVVVEAGAVVGQVRLERVLSEGGMGSVWIGTHLTLGSQVAVKFMASRLARDPDARGRFTREAAAAAQINSAHVVRILDHGFAEGDLPYIVMELLDGEDLSGRIERLGQLDLAETERVITQVARALKKSHELGIVHRDIKPANVFLTEQDGQTIAKLLDFGIAKRSGPAATASTATGSLVGTPFYMSPEHVMSAKAVDERADLWSLSVVAYECLTGALPFSGETIGAVSIAIDRGAFERPSALRCDLGPAVDAWFDRAFARAPASRFQTADELAESFRAALGGATVARREVEPPSEPGAGHTPPSRRAADAPDALAETTLAAQPRSWSVRIAAVAALALIAIGAVVWRSSVESQAPTEATAIAVAPEEPRPVVAALPPPAVEPVAEAPAVPTAEVAPTPVPAKAPRSAVTTARPVPAATAAPTVANPFTGRF